MTWKPQERWPCDFCNHGMVSHLARTRPGERLRAWCPEVGLVYSARALQV